MLDVRNGVTAGLGVDVVIEVEADGDSVGDVIIDGDDVETLEEGGNVAMAESAADLAFCLCLGEDVGRELTTEDVGCCCCCGNCVGGPERVCA